MRAGSIAVALLSLTLATGSHGVQGQAAKRTLDQVRHWAYNIQDVNTRRQEQALVGSHFDMYVLEPVVTEAGEQDFDIAGLIQAIRNHCVAEHGFDPIILAYVDIGQAENWRWYCDGGCEIGDPDWIVANDPDGWDDNFPVQFWRNEWKNIVIYGHQGRSHVEESLKAGFDGIYLDWVEAFSDENVTGSAPGGMAFTAREMLRFIEEIARYARHDSARANPDYLIVAQNAPDLFPIDPNRYVAVVDALAEEAVWFDGTGGFDNWGDKKGYNKKTSKIYPGWSREVLDLLPQIRQHMPVFVAEYAQKGKARKVYRKLAPKYGFVPYCTRRSLSRLSTKPYPEGYEPTDY
jgi:cysteinyl-tRNA synthetase